MSSVADDAAKDRRSHVAGAGFGQLIKLISEAQQADSIELRNDRPKQGSESSLIVFPPRKDAAAIARRDEITRLLRLRPNLRELRVEYGAYSGRDDEIDMKTRSMLEIMLEFAAAVQVPDADVADEKASPGAVSSQSPAPMSGPPMQVLVGDAAPKDAYVSVPYNGRWFWIPDNDVQSKSTFGIVMLLFSIADTGVKGAAPVVTIPANQ